MLNIIERFGNNFEIKVMIIKFAVQYRIKRQGADWL